MIPETKYAKSGDVHIAYQVAGDRPIDLVVVPTFTSHVEYACASSHGILALIGLAS